MFSYSKIHCHVVKFKKLVELHTYSNKRPKEPPTGKAFLTQCTPQQDSSLKSDSCLKMNP